MAILVLVEGKVKDGSAGVLEGIFKDILPDTRTYDGCKGITAYFDSERKTVLLVEHWNSRPQYEKYLGWRQETGVIDQLVAQLEGGPSIRYFDPSGA